MVHRAHQSGHVGVDEPVHDGLAVDLPGGKIGRAEDDAVVLHSRRVTMLSRADCVAYEAPGAVRADKVAAPNGPGFTGLHVTYCGRDADVILFDGSEFLAERYANSRQRCGMLPQHVFKGVLRDPLTFFRKQLVAGATTMQRIFEAGKFRAVHARREHHGRWIVRRDGRRLPKCVGNAPPAQVLARAHIGRLRARTVTNPVIAFHDKAGNAAMSKLDGERKADRPGSCHQHVGGLFCHSDAP